MKISSFLLVLLALAWPLQGKAAYIQTTPPRLNDIRWFPFNTVNGALHLGYAHYFSANWGLGAEGSYMKSDGSLYEWGSRVRESYVGPLVQYFVNPGYEGLFIEGGINYVDGAVTSNDETAEGGFAMPHLSLNLREEIKGGIGFTLGIGTMAYIGEPLTYVGPGGGTEKVFLSNPQWRIRFAVGTAF